MKKNMAMLVSLALTVSLGVSLVSCGDDDPPDCCLSDCCARQGCPARIKLRKDVKFYAVLFDISLFYGIFADSSGVNTHNG